MTGHCNIIIIGFNPRRLKGLLLLSIHPFLLLLLSSSSSSINHQSFIAQNVYIITIKVMTLNVLRCREQNANVTQHNVSRTERHKSS